MLTVGIPPEEVCFKRNRPSKAGRLSALSLRSPSLPQLSMIMRIFRVIEPPHLLHMHCFLI